MIITDADLRAAFVGQSTTRERQTARSVAAMTFAGRKGHGGGECTRRVMTRDDIEQLLAAVLAFHRMLRA